MGDDRNQDMEQGSTMARFDVLEDRGSDARPVALPSAERPALVSDKPDFLGFGLGLRAEHYQDILEGDAAVDWFEIISENYMVPGGQPLRILDRIRARYPVVMHGVSLSIASTAPADLDYLRGLKTLAARVEPKWISDHLCWTGVHGKNLHDLLPIPYTQESLDHVCSRIHLVQEYLGRALTLENVSTYVQFAGCEMTEWEFLSELTKRTGCWLLFDVNNVYVSAFNHGYDPYTFLAGIPADRVVQFHMAGHSHMGTAHHRYARQCRLRGRVGPLCCRAEPVRRRVNDHRTRRQHPAARRDHARSRAHPLDRARGAAGVRLRAPAPLRAGMKDFARLQSEFQRAILGGDDAILAGILDSPKQARDVLLDVYRNAYVMRLLEAIGTSFELLHLYVGDEMFEEMGRAYVAASPSHHLNMRWYARTLPAFLAETEPYADYPILTELAALETALNDAFDAAEDEVLVLADLAAIDPDAWQDLLFRPHASTHRFRFTTNVLDVWSALRNDEEVPTVEIADEPVHLVVWRQGRHIDGPPSRDGGGDDVGTRPRPTFPSGSSARFSRPMTIPTPPPPARRAISVSGSMPACSPARGSPDDRSPPEPDRDQLRCCGSGCRRWLWRPAAAQSAFLPEEGFPYEAFDRLRATHLSIGGGTITIAFAPGRIALAKPTLFEWIRHAAIAVSTYYGQLPVRSVRLLIVPVAGSGVRGGTTWGYRGAAIRMLLGSDADADDLDRDWMMTHEMVHTALPGMPPRFNWLSEGLAVYVEPIARVQAGFLTPRSIWADMVRDMPKGLPRVNDEGLDNTPTWGRTYWGGALFCLLCDLDIRRATQNRLGLQGAMRGVQAAGGNHTVDWPIRRILATADKAVGLNAMTALYERMRARPERVDLDALWTTLGIEMTEAGLVFHDDAPLAAARIAITRPPSPARAITDARHTP